MVSKYTRKLKNGREIDVFMDYEEHPENFIVYMKRNTDVSVFPTTVKEVNGEVARTLTDFLEDSKKLEEFENGLIFAIKISKGNGFKL